MSARILTVDDEPQVVRILTVLLTRLGYEVCGLDDSREALASVRSFHPEVCILDFNMPFVSGSVLLDEIKAIDSSVEVILLTGSNDTVLAVDLMKRGAADYLLKPIQSNQVELAVARALDHRRLVLEIAAYKLHLELLVAERSKALNEALRSLGEVHSATLETLAMALDLRDQGTSGHCRRVAEMTLGIARDLGLRGGELVQIEHGALLHDIGKLRIPDKILWKPTDLTPQEWKIMRRHPEYGFEFVNKIEFLRGAADIVLSHHEKFDGTGYPRGLKGKEISLGARIFAPVDTVDAMIHSRPYKQAVIFEDAQAHVRKLSGTHFDPELVEPVLTYIARHLA